MKKENAKTKKTNKLIGESIWNYGPNGRRKRPVEKQGDTLCEKYGFKKIFDNVPEF